MDQEVNLDNVNIHVSQHILFLDQPRLLHSQQPHWPLDPVEIHFLQTDHIPLAFLAFPVVGLYWCPQTGEWDHLDFHMGSLGGELQFKQIYFPTVQVMVVSSRNKIECQKNSQLRFTRELKLNLQTAKKNSIFQLNVHKQNGSKYKRMCTPIRWLHISLPPPPNP